jgi:Dienelactone hydrolase family
MRKTGILAATVFAVVSAAAHAQTKQPAQTEYDPPGGRGRPVVVISGQSGPANYVPFASELAAHGYYTVLVDSNELWLASGAGFELLKGIVVRAQASPKALPGKAGVVGFSKGGGVALAYATRMQETVAGVVAYYPLTSFITDAGGFLARAKVPTLMMPAVRDTYQNCCLIDTARKIAAAATKAAGTPVIEIVEFPDADHGFNLKGPAFRSNDAADAFRRTLAHLRKTVGEPAAKTN